MEFHYALSQTGSKQTFASKTLKKYFGGTSMAFTLKFATCLRILLFLNNRSVVHFCGWKGVGAGGGVT